MPHTRIKCVAGVVFGISFAVVQATTVAGQVGLERRIISRHDLAVPGYEVLLLEVTLAVGGREGRHTHPGELVGRILEGELTLEQEGLPTKIYCAGESDVIDAGRVHEGINKGTVPVKVFATLIVPKGKPLATPVGEATGAPGAPVQQGK